MPVDMTAIVLTYNEEIDLPDCLDSLKRLDCRIVVVDSGSDDDTIGIARRAGAEVVVHEFKSQAQQLNWALDNVAMESEWLLRLDADERVTPELAEELSERLAQPVEGVTGLYVKRQVHFMGRWIRHGGYYPTWLLRVWKMGAARSEDRIMDEHMVLSEGEAAFLKHDIVEESGKGLFSWTEKHNRYSVREAQAVLAAPQDEGVRPSLFGTPEARRRWLRDRAYGRMPIFVRPFLYFGYRYFFRLGFLDGRPGLVFHFLQGCWYRFQVDALLFESRSKRSRHKGVA